MPLMPLEQARALARTLCRAPAPVSLSPGDAHGRFLAEPVDAPRDLPGCDNSAMDGYAVCAAWTRGANRDRPARFRVVETIFAGHAPTRALVPGEAARIFTGAALPGGADAVVRQEAARPSGEEVELVVEAGVGDHVRRRAEEARRGQRVLERGTRVDAAVVGLAAALGVRTVKVYPRPKVAVLAVGDELLPPAASALPHQIHDSNGVMVAALAVEAGAEVVSVAREGDDPRALRARLEALLAEADVVITAGGASVGDRDLVKGVLRGLGADFAVDGVALKPGKPVGLGRIRERAVVVLPGNPGAARVAFDQLARPLLLSRQGVVEVRRRVRGALDAPRRKQPPLTYLLAARVPEAGDGRVVVRPQGAGQLLANVDMDGWAILPPGRAEFAAGDPVEVELLHGARFEPRVAPAVSVVGWSGAGKTGLLERVLPALVRRGLRVAVVKHSTHPHPDESEGAERDTQRLLRAGAAFCALSSPAQARATGPLVETLRHSGTWDLVLVEGWKDGPLPKVEVWREGLEPPLFATRPEVLAVVTTAALPGAPRLLDPGDTDELASLLVSG
jgi:molybdopterin molybdotransferase